LVIAGWPCQSHSTAGKGGGLQDHRSAMFWEMIRVIHHLQDNQVHSPAYILENIPLLGDARSRVVPSMHQVQQWLEPALLLDAASVGSCAHCPRLWWTNLVPPKVLKVAYSQVIRLVALIVDDILDAGRRSQAVECNDLPPLAVVNKVGSPRATLPTIVSFTASHAYQQGGSGLVWDERLHQLVEPNANEREHAMGFSTGTTAVPGFLEAIQRQLLGQVIDLTCLSWILSLGWAEQRRMHSEAITPIPFVSLQPTGMVQAAAGGAGPSRVKINLTLLKQHPWTSWDAMQEVTVIKECSKEDGGVAFSCEGQDKLDPLHTVADFLGEGQDNRDPACAFGAGAGEGQDNSDPAQPVAA
jgi:hypothetical protein